MTELLKLNGSKLSFTYEDTKEAALPYKMDNNNRDARERTDTLFRVGTLAT